MSVSCELAALQRAAARLGRPARERNACALPPLLVLTDPQRTPDPLALARSLPRGAGLVYRAFGAPDAAEMAAALATVARVRGLVLLVGANAALAQACGAHGVHLPERMVAAAPRLRARWPGVLISGAAHSASALRRGTASGLDAALLSTAFPSRSPSAGPPLGPVRLGLMVRRAGLPVYALGGVNASTLPRLKATGVAGAAVVDAAADRSRCSPAGRAVGEAD